MAGQILRSTMHRHVCGFNISATFPKNGALEIHLGLLCAGKAIKECYESAILTEGTEIIWKNGKYIPAVRGILRVELNKGADLLVVSVARGRFDFGLTLQS